MHGSLSNALFREVRMVSFRIEGARGHLDDAGPNGHGRYFGRCCGAAPVCSGGNETQALRAGSHSMNRRILLHSMMFASVCVVAPAYASVGERFLIADTNRPDPDGDVLDVAAATGQFTRFLALVP